MIEPSSIEELQERVAAAEKVKALGTRHSFNDIADTSHDLISTARLNRIVDVDVDRRRVSVEGGITYGELCVALHKKGFAVHNLASLPHISVAGACATATHGSGDKNGNLATVVTSVDMVTADGELVTFSKKGSGAKQGGSERADGSDANADFYGVPVSLGALGVVACMTLEIEPAFDVKQVVYEGLSVEKVADHFDALFSSAYSVSFFTEWVPEGSHQLWVKKRLNEDANEGDVFDPVTLGAKPASEHRHPLAGHGAEHCTPQMGIPGPWFERLPHFRMEFTPSSGEELQSEYFVAREHAASALRAVAALGKQIRPHLHVSEVRTIAADQLWLSPCYQQDSVGIHFTWKKEPEAVLGLLPLIEEALEPFQARPHWGKLFVMPPERLRERFVRLPDFQALVERWDPQGKFRNSYLDRHLFGSAV